MASPTDFIDFNTWQNVAGESEKELLQRQLEELQGLTGQANTQLGIANTDALREQNKQAQAGQPITAGLSNVGSYSQYLKTKQGAQDALLRLLAQRSGESGDVRGAMLKSLGYDDAAIAELEKLQGRQDKLGGESAAAGDSLGKSVGMWKAEAEKKAAAEKERAEKDAAFAQTFYGTLYEKWKRGVEGDFAEGLNSDDVKGWARMLYGGEQGGKWAPPQGQEKITKSIYRNAWGPSGGRYDPKTGRPINGELPEYDELGRPKQFIPKIPTTPWGK